MPPKTSNKEWKDDHLNPAGPALLGRHVVRDDRAASSQKTQEEIIAEAVHLKKLTGASTEVPELLLTSEEDVAFFRQRHRQQLEENVTRNYKQLNNFLRYAEWEEEQGDVVRARRVYEKAIPTHGMKPELWRHFAEFEVRCAASMQGIRSVFGRAVHALPQSDDLWLKYVATEIAAMDDDDVVRGIYREWIAVKGQSAGPAWEEAVTFEAKWAREGTAEVRIQRCRDMLSRYVTAVNDTRAWLFYTTLEESFANDLSRALEVIHTALKAVADPFADGGALYVRRSRLMGQLGSWEATGRSALVTAMSSCPTAEARKALFQQFGELDAEFSEGGVIAEEELCLANSRLAFNFALAEDETLRANGGDTRPDCEYLSLWRRIQLSTEDSERLSHQHAAASKLDDLVGMLSSGDLPVDPQSGSSSLWRNAVETVYGKPPPLQITERKELVRSAEGVVSLEAAFEGARLTNGASSFLAECPQQLAALAVRYAATLIQQGDVQRAQQAYEAALRSCQSVPSLWVAAARLEAVYLSNFQGARQLLGRAREHLAKTKDTVGLREVSDALVGLEWSEYQAARSKHTGVKEAYSRLQQVFMSCLRESPGDVDRWLQMVEVERDAGNLERASALLDKARLAFRPKGTSSASLPTPDVQAKLDLLHRHAVQLRVSQGDYEAAIGMYASRLQDAIAAFEQHSLLTWTDAVSITLHAAHSPHALRVSQVVSEYITFLMRVLYGPAMLAVKGTDAPDGSPYTPGAAQGEGYARVRAMFETEVQGLRSRLVAGLGRRDEEYISAAITPVVEMWNAFEREFGNDASLAGVSSHPAVAGRKRGRLAELAGAY